jgi:uncharacterized protein
MTDSRELVIHSCEDCACPVSGHAADYRILDDGNSAALADGSQWVRGRETVEVQVDRDNWALFNPLASSGVVVVNSLARHIYDSFRRPATLDDVRASWPGDREDADRICGRLSLLEMIHPVDRVQRPDFGATQARTLTAWLHVTNACNLRCPYCYVAKSADKMDEPTGHTAVEAVVRSAEVHGFTTVKLKYAGGEASLNHHLMLRLHARARELTEASGLGLQATMLSNGVRLPRTLVGTLRDEGIRVMISLDGLGEQHDIQRPFASGKPSFHLVERTIAQLIEQGHPPHLSITITSRNAPGVADVVRFALERDLTFSLNLFRDNDCAASFPDLRYQEQEMISSLLDAFGVIEEFLPAWSVLGSVLDRGQLVQPRQRACGVGQDYVVIDQDGRVAKCHMEIEKTLGDVFADDPLLLVRRDKALVQNLAVEEKEGCRDCTWRYWCSGGCSAATFRATGRYDIKSPNCNIYKAIYPAALRLEGLRLLRHATARLPGGVRSCHQRGQVVGVQEGRRRGRAPGVKAAGALQVLRCPQLVIDDAVHVRVVLGEVARGVLEVPEEVRPGMVPAQAPDVPLRVVFQHRAGAAADLVDVVDLPGRVVQEAHRRGQHQQVVVVGRAAQERAGALDAVADLESDPVGEERRRRLVIGAGQHRVPELARAYPGGAVHPGCPAAGTFGPAGAVVRRGRDRILPLPWRDAQSHPHAADRLGRREPVIVRVGRHADAGQAGRGAGQVVRVVDAHAHGDQPPGRCGDDPQLPAEVGAAEPAVCPRSQAEIGVVTGGLLDVRHADRDR